MTSTRAFAVLCSVFALGACDAGGVPIESAPAETAAVYCDAVDSCAGDFAGSLGGSSCRTNFTATFENGAVQLWQAAIDRGTVTYDAAATRACLDASQANGCNLFNVATPEACRDILVGTLEPGSACSFSEECAGDAYCDGASCPATAGTCSARKASGAECDGTDECVTGLVCEGGTCQTSSSRPGGPCDGPDAIACPLGEICVDGDEETVGTCTPLAEVQTAALGESCDPQTGTFCVSGLSCAVVGAGVGGAEFQCNARVGAGEACNVGFPSMCPQGQYCDANPFMGMFDGNCAPLPSDGQACAGSLEGNCAAGLVCVTGEAENTCVQPRANGAACEVSQECYSGRCESGVCAAPELCPL
ncbi:MAG: hypothetical protein VYE22_33050 [Myxococcota bacterium]|nr:hypothetical protein [Myxococcota bacterium]